MAVTDSAAKITLLDFLFQKVIFFMKASWLKVH